PLLRSCDIEYGKIHRDENESHDAAKHYENKRLDKFGQARNYCFHFRFIKVGYLDEHLIESTGVLSHVNHLNHHTRKYFCLGKRERDRFTRGDLFFYSSQRVFDYRVVHRHLADLDCVDEVNAGGKHGAECPGEASRCSFNEKVAEERQAEEKAIPGFFPFL